MNARIDRPARRGSPNEDVLAEAERGLGAVLGERIDEITDLWHRNLVTHLAIRPQAIFPGEELLDHMPLVVRHVIGLIERAEEIPRETLEALYNVADHWRDAGYSVEEALLHFRILNRVLHEELRAVIERAEPPLSGAHAAQIAETLSHGVTLVQAVVVGSYRDREEERFGHYASTLSHEVRGPLSTALATIQTLDLLEQKAPRENRVEVRKEALRRIERTLFQMREVLDAVTTIVVPGQTPTEPGERKPLSELVSVVLEEFRSVPEDVVVEAAPGIPDVAVPQKPILLALHNLVRNAVAYSDPEKPDRWVRVRCDRDEERDCWLLRVRDNGIGIPEGERQLIFRRFRRGKAARGKGLGLGLSIVRDAARYMNGDVILESRPGQGSTFTFAFPAGEALPPSGGGRAMVSSERSR